MAPVYCLLFWYLVYKFFLASFWAALRISLQIKIQDFRRVICANNNIVQVVTQNRYNSKL